MTDYTYFLDTKYQANYSSTPSFVLDNAIVLSNPNNWFEVQVLSCDIPFSFNTLSTPNNTLNCRLVVPQDSINYFGSITIPPGNYSITQLLTILSNLLVAFMTASGFHPTHFPTFNFSYDKSSGKVNLGLVLGAGSHDFSLTLYWTTADLLAEYFGFYFTANTVLSYNTSGVITSTNFISVHHVNVNPITALYLRSSTLHQVSNNSERLVENAVSLSDILARVPITNTYNTWLMYQSDGYRVKINNKTIDALSFYLTTLSYDPVDFNGLHWRICIKITEVESPLTIQMKQLYIQNATEVNNLSKQKEDLVNQLKTLRDEMASQVLGVHSHPYQS